ncbi:MAG TPA: hypothetical protein PLL64_08425 [Rhodothermales bacterium]|nr:hypothetical protein [Bacteroidota bacterium]HRK74286.1 hypothetical protein [Rhodothermales bacterium]HRR08315.1 hypothetical protein [Rhodothermales bacterium]
MQKAIKLIAQLKQVAETSPEAIHFALGNLSQQLYLLEVAPSEGTFSLAVWVVGEQEAIGHFLPMATTYLRTVLAQIPEVEVLSITENPDTENFQQLYEILNGPSIA